MENRAWHEAPIPLKTIRDMRSFIRNYTYTQTPEEKGIQTAEKTVVNATVGLQILHHHPKKIYLRQPTLPGHAGRWNGAVPFAHWWSPAAAMCHLTCLDWAAAAQGPHWTSWNHKITLFSLWNRSIWVICICKGGCLTTPTLNLLQVKCKPQNISFKDPSCSHGFTVA